MEFELYVFEEFNKFELKIAMYNRCPHFYGGILPISRRKLILCFVVKTSAVLAILFLVILPETSIAAAPKYETAYACEGKTLTIECEPGYFISLIRANYGRFSITICNDHGNVEWSVNCMFPKSLKVLSSKCAHKQNCSVFASTNIFGDPCPGTHKYLEAHYQCVSASQTSTTTSRPSPPWLITNQPNTWSTSTVREVITTSKNLFKPSSASSGSSGITDKDIHLVGKPSSTIDHNDNNDSSSKSDISSSSSSNSNNKNETITSVGTRSSTSALPSSSLGGRQVQSSRINDSLEIGINSQNSQSVSAVDDQQVLRQSRLTTTSVPIGNTFPSFAETRRTERQKQQQNQQNLSEDNSSNNNNKNYELYTTQSSLLVNKNNINNNHHDRGGIGGGLNDGNSYYCGPTTARNLFWNITKAGEINVQPCPGGATGIAKWRCILVRQPQYHNSHHYFNQDKHYEHADNDDDCDRNNNNNNCNNKKVNAAISSSSSPISDNSEPLTAWHPKTPDLTQCRSLWLNNLEIRVNQRDSSLISIANDLSQVTSSKTLYGGDMLVTTKIIQTMSEKMSYDIETFPDQKQREAIIYELLHGVVKTGSNLLDISQQVSWLDLSFEDQMRVATSLLTGIEDNAFLLADTITRERNVVQKVKNILLSIRVLETRNIISNEMFPDAKVEQWHVSDDRIELPRGALIENSEGGLVRIVFVAFDRLESILKPSFNNLDLKFSTNYVQNSAMNQTNPIKNLRILNSKVISASLGKGRHIQLSQPIRLVLRHLKLENVTNPTCVFWNYIDHAWSEDGCYLEETNRSHTICMCNHLTNFAILMDIVDEHHNSLLSIFDNNMRILIYISIAICLIFIIIAILTLKIFNGIFVKVRQQISQNDMNHENNHQVNINRNRINTTIQNQSSTMNANQTTTSINSTIAASIHQQQQQQQSSLPPNNYLIDINNSNNLNRNNLILQNDNNAGVSLGGGMIVDQATVLEMVAAAAAATTVTKNSNNSSINNSNCSNNMIVVNSPIITASQVNSQSYKHNNIIKCTNTNSIMNTTNFINSYHNNKNSSMMSAITLGTTHHSGVVVDHLNIHDNTGSNNTNKQPIIIYN